MPGNVSFKQSFKAPVSTYKSSRLLFIHVLKQFDKRSKHVHAESGMGDPDPTLPLLFSRQSHVLNFCLSIFLNATFFPVLHPVQCFGVNPTSWVEVKSCILSINLHFPESQTSKTPFQTFFMVVTSLIFSQILSTYSLKRKCPGFSLKNSYLDIVALVRVYGLSDLAIMESWESVEI